MSTSPAFVSIPIGTKTIQKLHLHILPFVLLLFVGALIDRNNISFCRIGARVWIARILISWGIVATLSGLVHTTYQLYIVRFLLGLAEAGYFPGIVLYLTYWFPRREQARAFALFIMATPVTTIFGAPNANGLAAMVFVSHSSDRKLEHRRRLGVARRNEGRPYQPRQP